MKPLFTLLLCFFVKFAQGMEVKVSCQMLGGTGVCYMARENLSFMSINGRPIYFVHGQRCSERACDWIANASPYILREGDNEAYFHVATKTTDQNTFTDHRYDFFFSGVWKDFFRSPRQGSQMDSVTKSITLALQEIDPALYNEYLDLKSIYESSDREDVLHRLNKLGRERAEINKRIRELEEILWSIKDKNFDEVDESTLVKLGVGDSQLRLLKTRRDELDAFSKDAAEKAQSQIAQVTAKYEAVRARAKTYNSSLPELIPKPHVDESRSDEVSVFVQELHSSLIEALVAVEASIGAQNLSFFRKAIRNWKDKSDFAVSLYTESSELNSTEREVLYRIISDGTQKIFASGVTPDLWRKLNVVQPSFRETIDRLAEEEIAEAIELRQKLNFKKIPEPFMLKVNDSLLKVEKLAEKINAVKADSEDKNDALKIARASLASGLESISTSIDTQSDEGLHEADQSLSIGTLVLDIGLSFVPFVGSARNAFELFAGRNVITGEKLTTADYSMAFVGLFTGLVGMDVSKVPVEKALKVYQKIATKARNTYKLHVDSLRSFPQVDTMIEAYKKLRKPIVALVDSKTVNNILTSKYGKRFEDPAFAGGQVISRLTEPGEEFCRLFWKIPSATNKISEAGGIFVFRCADILRKSLDEILDMASVPTGPTGATYFVAKLLPPPGVRIFEGAASSLYGKKGGGIQAFLDISDSKTLELLREISPEKSVGKGFEGF